MPELIQTDNPFTADERDMLVRIAGLIVPADPGRSLPSASDVDILSPLPTDDEAFVESTRSGLEALANASEGRAFVTLDDDTRESMVTELRAANPQFLRAFALHVVTHYYQDDRVLEAIGMGARPPFPLGYEVKSGDLSLLDPVRKRGPFYREV